MIVLQNPISGKAALTLKLKEKAQTLPYLTQACDGPNTLMEKFAPHGTDSNSVLFCLLCKSLPRSQFE